MKYVGNQPGIELIQTYSDKFDYIQPGNPAVDTNPSTLYATWLNATTGNQFICTDNTAGANVWKLASGHRGALVYHSAVVALANGAWVPLPFDTEDYDTDAFHNNVTNNTRITIPVGVHKVRFNYGCGFAASAAGHRIIILRKNGVDFIPGTGTVRVPPDSTGSSTYLCTSTAVLAVAAGDYFENLAKQTTGGSINTDNASHGTFFSIEVIE